MSDGFDEYFRFLDGMQEISLLDEQRIRCNVCGQEWSARLPSGGLRWDYWQCPNGCNAGGAPHGGVR